MFAEHISLKFIENEIVVSARRLWMVNIQPYTQLDIILKICDFYPHKVAT